MQKCNCCKAFTGNEKHELHYEPIANGSPVREDHPAFNCLDQKLERRKTARRAKATEKRIKDEIARETIASGAAHGDGDLALLKGELRVEIKDRGQKKSWNLTMPEFLKGKRQGIDVFAIQITDEDNVKRTMYMLTEELFGEVLALLKKGK